MGSLGLPPTRSASRAFRAVLSGSASARAVASAARVLGVASRRTASSVLGAGGGTLSEGRARGGALLSVTGLDPVESIFPQPITPIAINKRHVVRMESSLVKHPAAVRRDRHPHVQHAVCQGALFGAIRDVRALHRASTI